MPNYKKPVFWIVVTAIVICVAVAGCSRTDSKELPAVVVSDYIVKSGDDAAAMISFTEETVIADYVDFVYWLTINPGEDETVPFTVWQDDKEIRGFYNAFDTESFMPIEYTVPSGLDPQTYLFQNADITKEYIVLATFSTEPDAKVYAFGARFDNSDSSVGGVDDTTGITTEYRFNAEVLEVHNDYLLVVPEEGSAESRSADKIEVSRNDKTFWPLPKVGDFVTVVYNGEIQETYPARITKVYGVKIYEVLETVKGNLKTYYKNADGTYQLDGRIYQYRLEITGRMHNAATESTFVYLSNHPEIAFDRAWKAAGLSSYTEDYFPPEEAVLVEMFTDTQSNPFLKSEK